MKFLRHHLQRLPSTTRRATESALAWWRNTSLPVRSIVALCAVGAVVTALWISIGSWDNDPSETSQPTRSTPDYQTVLPARTTIDELGGWRKLDPPSGEPLYVYLDTIDGVDITVSQQLLPRNFMENTRQQVADFAKSFGANSEISIDGGDKLYVGTSAQGPQSAVLIKNGLLILIKSQQKIDDASWKRYAESLE